MKNDIKKYLTLGAVLAGSAFMVSCDGDDVSIVQDSGVANAITEAVGNKPVAPIALAKYPLTSLKLAIETAGGNCSSTGVAAGDEIELDFDSTDVTSATDSTADAFADLTIDSTVIFGIIGQQGFVNDIVNLASTFTMEGIYAGIDETGDLVLGDLTFTPLASNQQSVSGRFIGSTTVEVAFNQDTDNVVVDLIPAGNVTLSNPAGGGDFTVLGVTVYEDVAGKAVEVESLDGSVTHESLLGATNYGISVNIAIGNELCTLNFAVSQATADTASGGNVALLVNADTADIQAVMDLLEIDTTLNVADAVPVVNEIPANTPAIHLIEANTLGGVEGSYRHDFDSSVGTPETIINGAPINGNPNIQL
jgi:hypothetical protein